MGNYLRRLGFDVFDDWFAAGKIADDEWQAYETKRGRSYGTALRGIAARHVFSLDKHHIDRCDIGVLMLPAGKSGHLELGYMIGQGKPGYVLFEKEPERWDQMYQFATGVLFEKEALAKALCDNRRISRGHQIGQKVTGVMCNIRESNTYGDRYGGID